MLIYKRVDAIYITKMALTRVYQNSDNLLDLTKEEKEIIGEEIILGTYPINITANYKLLSKSKIEEIGVLIQKFKMSDEYHSILSKYGNPEDLLCS